MKQNEHQVRTSRMKGVRDLDSMNIERLARGLIAYHPQLHSIDDTVQLASLDIPTVATADTLKRLVAINPDCFWAISKNDGTQLSLDTPDGLIALLPLTEDGTDALFSGALNLADPQTDFIARQWQRPSSIYVWCIWTEARASAGISLVMERFKSPKYKDAILFCRSTTASSDRFFPTLGWKYGARWKDRSLEDMMYYDRASKKSPIPVPNNKNEDLTPKVTVEVARDISDILQVFAIRAATYIVEDACPYHEEFDGNDFASTHLIGRFKGEPAGCVRVRYFSKFCKIERLAVRKEYRRSTLAFELIRSAIEIGRRKGYTDFYGYASEKFVKLWSRFGARSLEEADRFVVSGIEYIKMKATFPPHEKPIMPSGDPYVLIRPEGFWDQPGILEKDVHVNDNVSDHVPEKHAQR